MSIENEQRGRRRTVRERDIKSEKYLFKAMRKSSMILRRSRVRLMNFIIFTRSLT